MVILFCVPTSRILRSRERLWRALSCRYITDNGNYILDLAIEGGITDPKQMDRDLKGVTGVVDHGIFIDMATMVIIAEETGIKVMRK